MFYPVRKPLSWHLWRTLFSLWELWQHGNLKPRGVISYGGDMPLWGWITVKDLLDQHQKQDHELKRRDEIILLTVQDGWGHIRYLSPRFAEYYDGHNLTSYIKVLHMEERHTMLRGQCPELLLPLSDTNPPGLPKELLLDMQRKCMLFKDNLEQLRAERLKEGVA